MTTNIIDETKPDKVCHLAAMAGVRYSIENPEKYVQVNIQGFIHLLEQSVKNNVSNFVYASSMCVYGNNKNNVNEKNNPKPISFYGISKKTAEEYINFISLPNTTKVVLRLFNVYGP